MPDLIGHSYADEYICADYSDKEKILEIVKEKQIDRIVSCANDFGVLTACYVAEKMGWPGHDSYETAVTLHHKDKFKEFTYENDIPSPRSYSFQDKDLALEHIKNVEYPIIVKANDLTGGKGILKAENEAEAKKAVDNAFSKSRDKNIVIEPYIEGTQHTIVTFLVNKKIVAYSSCNCYSPINPYLIQTEILPADDIDELKDELFGIVEKIASKLDLADGILALQYIKEKRKTVYYRNNETVFWKPIPNGCRYGIRFPMGRGNCTCRNRYGLFWTEMWRSKSKILRTSWYYGNT